MDYSWLGETDETELHAPRKAFSGLPRLRQRVKTNKLVILHLGVEGDKASLGYLKIQSNI